MPKLPRPTGAEMVRFLQSQGFSIMRIRGGHQVLARQEVRTSVPVHAGQTIKIGTLRGILRDIDMSAHDFARLWKN